MKNASACALFENRSGARIANCVLTQMMPSPIASGTWQPMYIAREEFSSRSDRMPKPAIMSAQPM